MNLGRRIYFDKGTGKVIQDTGECSGDVVETTPEQDFAVYAALAERVPETVGMLQLEYGQYGQDFRECSGYCVNLNSGELEFTYPDPEADPVTPPDYQAPLTERFAELEAENAGLALELAQTQAQAEQTAQESAALLLSLVEGGVL